MLTSIPQPHLSFCVHCGEKADSKNSVVHSLGKLFCCHGCEAAYRLLADHELLDYYQFKKDAFELPQLKENKNPSDDDLAYLKDADFLADAAQKNKGLYLMSFYVEGIHCSACLWLFDKLPQLIDGVKQSQFNISNSTLLVWANDDQAFYRLAQNLAQFRYKIHPILEQSQVLEHQQKEEKSYLKKIAVAACCSGNIMLFSFSIYAGAINQTQQWFNLVSLLLFLPIFFYSALPFYQTVYSSIKSRTLSIDIPIVLAIVVGFILSLYSIASRKEWIYFDSLSMLVLFLLSSRALLKKAQSKLLGSHHLLKVLSPQVANRINPLSGIKEKVAVHKIKVGEIIWVDKNEMLPIDGEVQQGCSEINQAILNGESEPVLVKEGSRVYAGTENLTDELYIKCLVASSESRMSKLVLSIEMGEIKKASLALFSDHIAKYFISIVLTLATFTFLYFALQHRFEAAFTRSLAILMVSCPCTFAFATSLAFSIYLKKAAQKGLLIKNSQSFERIAQIKNIILDKTGTLSTGKFKIKSIIQEQQSESPYLSILYSLELKSSHPIAKSICKELIQNQFGKVDLLSLSNFKENIGQGVEASYQNKLYEVKKIKKNSSFTHQLLNELALFEDGKMKLKILLEDEIQAYAPALIEALKQKNKKIFLLTGDQAQAAMNLGKSIGLYPYQIFYSQSAEDKITFIKKTPHSMMVGDGANDALAMAAADVGVSVQGSMELALQSSDVYLTKEGLKGVHKLFDYSHAVLQVIYRNLALSICYNIFSVSLAISGYIHPLIAAIIMPLSSGTVLLSTLIGNKTTRK